jgi:hypothetical protein
MTRRLRVLLAIERALTKDEQDELDARILERRANRRHARALAGLAERARREWAERSVDREWRGSWEARAAKTRKRYGGSSFDAQGAHFLHVMTESKTARRARSEYRRDYELMLRIDERRANRIERKRAAKASTSQPITPQSQVTTASPSTSPPTAMDDDQPRRHRVRAGIVAQYDAFGRRVG